MLHGLRHKTNYTKKYALYYSVIIYSVLDIEGKICHGIVEDRNLMSVLSILSLAQIHEPEVERELGL